MSMALQTGNVVSFQNITITIGSITATTYTSLCFNIHKYW